MALSHPKAPRTSKQTHDSAPAKATIASRWRAAVLLLLLIGLSGYAIRQFQWQRQVVEVKKLVEKRAIKSAAKAVQQLERDWGKSGESHFLRARLARYSGLEDDFSTEINRAALQGISADKVKHEENLFIAQAGRIDSLPGSWPDLLANPVESLDESASSLLDGLIQTGNLSAATSVVDVWEKQEPDSFFIDLYRGKIARQNQEPEKAKDFYEKAYEKKKDYIPLLQELGEIYFVILAPQKAVGFLEQAIQEAPDSVTLKTSLAESYIAVDRFEEAAKIVEPFVQPRDVNSDARGMLGRAYLGMGENQKVVDVLLPVHQAWPDDIDTNRNLATAYNLLGNEERAEFHDQAGRRNLNRTEDLLSRRNKQKQDPSNADYCYSVGHDLLECVSRVEGQQMLVQCLEINGQHEGAIKDLIHYYGAAGDIPMVQHYQSKLDAIKNPAPTSK